MKKTILAPLGLAMLLASSVAAAKDDNDHGRHRGPGPHGPHRELFQALQQSKISAAQAVAIAEKESGARADNIELEMKRGRPVYDIDLRDDKQEHEFRIDATNGEIIKRESEYEKNMPRYATVTLIQAIETAEKEVGAKVIDAELEGRRQGLVYEIKLLAADGGRYFAEISADDGKILRGSKPIVTPNAADAAEVLQQEEQAAPPPLPRQSSARWAATCTFGNCNAVAAWRMKAAFLPLLSTANTASCGRITASSSAGSPAPEPMSASVCASSR